MDKIKFKEDPNLIELAENVFLYKNFFDLESLNSYTNILDKFEENDWHQHGNFEIGDHEETFWGDKCSLDIIDRNFHDKIFNFFAPNYWMYQHTNFVRLKTGQSSNEVSVNNSLNNEKNMIDYCDYKVAWYLGSFGGGAIVFPDINLTYTPEPNDLLVFDIKYKHYTEEVTSGNRYSYMDYLIYHPGYFMP
jgi:hypothetical protein